MKPKPHTVRTLIAAVLSLALGGCFSAVVGGAAVGAKSVIDRRTTGAQTDDNVMALRIETTARSYLRQNNQTKGYTPQISVVGYNRHLLLLGQVATEGENSSSVRLHVPNRPPKAYTTTLPSPPCRALRATSPATLGTRPKSAPRCWASAPLHRRASKSLPTAM